MWWLRSPGDYSGSAAEVGYGGWVYGYGKCGGSVDDSGDGVRPALHLNLQS